MPISREDPSINATACTTPQAPPAATGKSCCTSHVKHPLCWCARCGNSFCRCLVVLLLLVLVLSPLDLSVCATHCEWKYVQSQTKEWSELKNMACPTCSSKKYMRSNTSSTTCQRDNHASHQCMHACMHSDRVPSLIHLTQQRGGQTRQIPSVRRMNADVHPPCVDVIT